nr:hypothetical protein [Verrucomicrobiota bacterium]
MILWLTLLIGCFFGTLITSIFGETAARYGIGLGLVFGTLAGLLTAMNYLALLHGMRLELRRRRRNDGQPLSRWRLRLKRAQFILLLTTPLMVAYEVVRFFSPRWDLAAGAQEWAGWDLGRYALLLAALALGMNVCLSIAPLFREMVERCSILAAVDFNRAWLDQKSAAAQPGSEKAVFGFESYVGARGEWVHFGFAQVFHLYAVAMFLALNGFTQAVDKLSQAGVYPADAMPFGMPGTVVDVFSGMLLVGNAAFLIAVATAFARKLTGAPDHTMGSAGTVEAMAAAAENQELLVATEPGGAVRLAFGDGKIPSAPPVASPAPAASAAEERPRPFRGRVRKYP